MLKKGTLTKIYEYYYTIPKYEKEILKALKEFFNRPNLGQDGSLEMNEKSEGLFNEWFLYDFVLNNGKTVLADFIEENPLKLSKEDLILYKDLLNTNEYGLYKVIRVDINQGLMLQNLQTEKEIYVQEKSLTVQVFSGDMFFGRTAKVGDHNELVCADSFGFSDLDETLKELLKRKITPKEVHDSWENRTN